jgi:hypothetical protein
LVRTQPGCKTAAFYSRWERSSAVKLQLQAFAALYSWVGTQLDCKTLFYSWWERSSAVKLRLQAFAALYSWVGTQLGRKTQFYGC